MPEFRFLAQAYMYASLLIFAFNIPTLYSWVFLSNCLAYRPILRQDVNERKPCVDNRPNYIVL